MVESIYKCQNCGDVVLDLDRTVEERSVPTSKDLQYHICRRGTKYKEWGLLDRVGFYERVDHEKNTD